MLVDFCCLVLKFHPEMWVGSCRTRSKSDHMEHIWGCVLSQYREKSPKAWPQVCVTGLNLNNSVTWLKQQSQSNTVWLHKSFKFMVWSFENDETRLAELMFMHSAL